MKRATAPRYVKVGSTRISNADVQALGSTIARLTKGGQVAGRTVAQGLVKASRPTESPTHHLFEWDDSKAAESYRLEQASELIRSVNLVFEQPDGTEGRVRAFPSIVIGNGERAYVPMQKVLSDEDLTRQMLDEAKREACAWAARHDALRNLAQVKPVFRAVNALLSGKDNA